MRIVLGVPIINELSKGHLELQIKDAISVGFDDIVFLDDGSTDGSFEYLLNLNKIYNNIHVFRFENNTVVNNGPNRWACLAEHCKKFSPDWITVRAADMLFSKKAYKYYGDMFRSRLEDIYKNNDFNIVSFPQAHLWRSNFFFRSDVVWGSSAKFEHLSLTWRADSEWSYTNEFKKSGMHAGRHLPNSFGINKKSIGINYEKPKNKFEWSIIVLHYGYSTHKKISDKFEWNMYTASKSKNSIGMPHPDDMPHPTKWAAWNGYRAAHEPKSIEFTKVFSSWLIQELPTDLKLPKIESLYDSVLKYNPRMAKEYNEFFQKNWC